MFKVRPISVAVTVFMVAMFMAPIGAQAQAEWPSGPIDPPAAYGTTYAKRIAVWNAFALFATTSTSIALGGWQMEYANLEPIDDTSHPAHTASSAAIAGSFCTALVNLITGLPPMTTWAAQAPSARVAYGLVTFKTLSAFAGHFTCSSLVRFLLNAPPTNRDAADQQEKLDNCTDKKTRAGSGRTLLQEQSLYDNVVGVDYWSRKFAEEAYRAAWYTKDYLGQRHFVERCDWGSSTWQPIEVVKWCGDNTRYGNRGTGEAVRWAINAMNHSKVKLQQHNQLAKSALSQYREHMKLLKERQRQCVIQKEEL